MTEKKSRGDMAQSASEGIHSIRKGRGQSLKSGEALPLPLTEPVVW